MNSTKQAFILAAGLGTRLQPLTTTRPKALVEVAGEPMLAIVIKRLISLGFVDLVINVHYFSDQILIYLKEHNNFGVNIFISDESGKLLDTGGGIMQASQFFRKDSPVLIHNTDVLSDIDLDAFMDYHIRSDALVSLAVQKRQSSNYLMFDSDGVLCGWKNVLNGRERISRIGRGDLRPLGFSGIHMINPELMDVARQAGCLKADQDVFSIIGTYLCLAKSRKLLAYDHSGTFWMDIGKHEQLEKAGTLIKEGHYKPY